MNLQNNVIHDLFGREHMDWHVACLIQDLRKRFLDSGGDPKDFPNWLKAQGVEARGSKIHIKDAFVTMAKLKYETQ